MSLGEDIATAIASGAKRKLRKLGLNRQNIDEIVLFVLIPALRRK